MRLLWGAKLTPVEAVDRLNSWIRSDSHWGSFSSPRYAIYFWKGHLVSRALAELPDCWRTVHVCLKCRDCGGSGKYVDSYGYNHLHCRKCSNSGMVRLDFLETVIEEFKWHTPRDKTWQMNTITSAHWEAAPCVTSDWKPNAKGRDLEPWQVAECLNICETMLPRPGMRAEYVDTYCYQDRDNGKYKLFVGRSEKVCEFCKRPAVHKGIHPDSMDGSMHHVSRGNIEWSAWACESCSGLFSKSNRWSDTEHKYLPHGGNGKSIFDEFAIPQERLEHPAIREWLARRSV